MRAPSVISYPKQYDTISMSPASAKSLVSRPVEHFTSFSMVEKSSPKQVQDYEDIAMPKDPLEHQQEYCQSRFAEKQRLEEMLVQSLNEVHFPGNPLIAREKDEGNSRMIVRCPPTFPSLARKNVKATKDLELNSKTRIRQEELIEENLRRICLDLKETNARELELRLKIERLEQQLQEDQARKQRIYGGGLNGSFDENSPTMSTAEIEVGASSSSRAQPQEWCHDSRQQPDNKHNIDEELSVKMRLVVEMQRHLAEEEAARRRLRRTSFWSRGIFPC